MINLFIYMSVYLPVVVFFFFLSFDDDFDDIGFI